MAIVAATLVVGVIGLLIGILLIKTENRFHVDVDPTVSLVRSKLPGSNCGGCGFAGCDALAEAIATGKAPTNACKAGGPSVAAAVSEVMGVEAQEAERFVAFVKCAGNCEHAAKRGNYVGIEDCVAAANSVVGGGKACTFGCMGYGSCVAACQFDAIHVVDGVAKVDPAKCVGCGACAATCPQKLIELVPALATYRVHCSNPEKGPVVKKSCDIGCIGCGICAKQCESGAITVTNNVAHIDYSKCTSCGKCAAKCPSKVIWIG